MEFMSSCGNVLPVELRDRIDCPAMATEADGPGSCISKPGIQEKYFFAIWVLEKEILFI